MPALFRTPFETGQNRFPHPMNRLVLNRAYGTIGETRKGAGDVAQGSALMIGGIDQFVVETYETDDIGALRDICVNFFRSVGIEMMSYHHLPPPGAKDYTPNITVAAVGFPKEWSELYVENNFFDVDPIPKRALDSTIPFWWSEISKDPSLTSEELEYLDALSAANIGDGLAVSVFGPHGRNGYAALGFGKKKMDLSIVDIAALQWACQLGHQRYCGLLRSKAPNGVTLSKREVEILEWVARGKSNSVIADIVGISTYTVDTYLRRIYGKLHVSDRVTAALRGMAIGLVT